MLVLESVRAAEECLFIRLGSKEDQAKVTQEVKQTHTEQLNRLQLKHQTDWEFLEDLRKVWALWRSYLEGVMKVSQSRISGCDNYRNQISDPVKTLRVQKDLQLKKCCEQLARAQADLQVTIRDLTKTRKTYQEAEQTAQVVREKADMEAKYVLADLHSK
ncbi:SH3 domains protein 2 Carom [Triplophysa tibetana]|uniref:SH3 domains protein 2 Carom n=1 Tax=Triplophysa tibetana TaxID=1572043 RepID=A0A5A9N4B6_9TELE|nr:SH3 domains protein 2 Carom [Triplophysa tibetana]